MSSLPELLPISGTHGGLGRRALGSCLITPPPNSSHVSRRSSSPACVSQPSGKDPLIRHVEEQLLRWVAVTRKLMGRTCTRAPESAVGQPSDRRGWLLGLTAAASPRKGFPHNARVPDFAHAPSQGSL